MAREDVERLARRIEAVIESRRVEYVELFAHLLTFRTTSGSRTEEGRRDFEGELDRCLAFLGHRVSDLGWDYRRYERMAAVAESPGPDGAPSVGVATHVDVVPPGEDWTVPPFGGSVHDGKIWGRGAQDDKGPVAAILAALDTLHALEDEVPGLRRSRRLKLFFGTREETEAWPDIERLLAEEQVPEFVVVPDGAFPVINAEKGIITLAASLAVPGGEDRGGACRVEVRSGVRSNAVPDRAAVELGASSADTLEDALADVRAGLAELAPDARPQVGPVRDDGHGGARCTVNLCGEAAHAAFPHRGHNAALDALAVVTLVESAPPPVLRYARAILGACRPLDGTGLGLDHEGTTVSLGVLSLDQDGGRALINVRYPAGLTADAIREKLADMLADAVATEPDAATSVSFHGWVQPPLHVDAERHRHLLDPLNLAYESVTGREGGYAGLAGTTYAKAFPLAVAFGPVDFAAGDEELAHAADEHVPVDRYLENVAIYATAICLLAYDWSALRDA